VSLASRYGELAQLNASREELHFRHPISIHSGKIVFSPVEKGRGLTGLVIKDDSSGRVAGEWREMQPFFSRHDGKIRAGNSGRAADAASANITRFLFSLPRVKSGER